MFKRHGVAWLLTTAFCLSDGAPLPAEGVDRYGDPLPPGALARLGTVRFRHGFSVGCAALSPDGKIVAAADDTTIRLWDASSGRELRSLVGHTLRVEALAYSPDGKVLASGAWDKTLRLWDPVTGKQLQIFTGHKDQVANVAFSADGHLLASTSRVGNLGVWNLQSAKADPIFLENKQQHDKEEGELVIPKGLSFSGDGKSLISGGKMSIRRWETKSWNEQAPLAMDWRWGDAMAVSRDGATLTTAGNSKFRVWNISTGKETGNFPWAEGYGLSALALTPDGKSLASAHWDCTIRLWDIGAGKQLQQCKGHQSNIRSLDFSADGKTLVSGAYDGTIRLWETASGRQFNATPGHAGAVTALAFAADGALISRGDDNVRRWNIATARENGETHWQGGGVSQITFSPDRKLAAWAYPESENASRFVRVHLIDTATWKIIRSFERNASSGMQSLAFSADGKFLAGGYFESSMRIWDVADAKEIRFLTMPPSILDPVTSVAFSPDGQTLACFGPDHCYRIWNLLTGKEIRRFGTREWPVSCLAFSRDGKTLASAHRDYPVRLWEAATGRLRCELKGHEGRVGALAFSPDGKTLASAGSDGGVRLWDIPDGRERHCFRGHRGAVGSLSFAPNGKSLASGSSDTSILIWDVGLGKPGPLVENDLSPKKLHVLWSDLADTDTAKAHRAVCILAAAPKLSVPLLQDRLSKVPDESKRITQLIRQMDSDVFEARQKASIELEKLGKLAEPGLRLAIADGRSLEARRRIQNLLGKIESQPIPADVLRGLRAIEALEYAASAEARQVLMTLAKGAPAALLTREANASLQRLAVANE